MSEFEKGVYVGAGFAFGITLLLVLYLSRI